MNSERYTELAACFPNLHLGVLGDFCLDRYFDIDPQRGEISIETGLPVFNVAGVRSLPGGAGTVLNNLVALGIGKLSPIGFCGEDGEGFELRRALAHLKGVELSGFLTTDQRRTFTYGKPLVVRPGQPPQELNRLDFKNWTATPGDVEDWLVAQLEAIFPALDGLIVMDQVDHANTGVVTQRVLQSVEQLSQQRPDLLILADSRRGLRDYPPLGYKMNAAELSGMSGLAADAPLVAIQSACLETSQRTGRPVFVTLAERGILGALPDGTTHHVPAFAVRGPIDIVGAGDSVTANLTAALAAGASLAEALQAAMAASSLVIHQLGVTGTANVIEICQLLDQL